MSLHCRKWSSCMSVDKRCFVLNSTPIWQLLAGFLERHWIEKQSVIQQEWKFFVAAFKKIVQCDERVLRLPPRLLAMSPSPNLRQWFRKAKQSKHA
eukprot:3422918-Amphidinium_carterae.1